MSELADDVAALKTKIDALHALVQGVPQRITDAVADALAKGADPATLTAITALSAEVDGDIQTLSPPAPAPAPAPTP